MLNVLDRLAQAVVWVTLIGGIAFILIVPTMWFGLEGTLGSVGAVLLIWSMYRVQKMIDD